MSTEMTEPNEVEEDTSNCLYATPMYSLFSESNFLLILFTLSLVCWQATYQKLMFGLYGTEIWANFDHFVKVMTNHCAHYSVKRSYERNLVFNLMRCMADETLFYMYYGQIPPFSTLFNRVFLIFLFTAFF